MAKVLRLLWCACIFLLGIFGEKGKRLATGEKTALGEAFVWNGPCWMVNEQPNLNIGSF